jgi:YHS domain-containing protein
MQDPICGMEIGEDTKFRSSYKGMKYYFCSEACKITFEKNPQAYAK